jgi:hypothetical protein
VQGSGSYEVWRGTNASNLTRIATVQALSYSDTGVLSNNFYVYAVRALDPTGAPGAYSAVDLAFTPTSTSSFTDIPLVSEVTAVKAVHVNELRQRINALRGAAGLSAFSFTNPTITAGVSIVHAVEVSEMRTALDQARSQMGLPPLTYTDSTLTAGSTIIAAAHIQQLRDGTR